MDRFKIDDRVKGVATINDTNPRNKFKAEVCTIYSSTSAFDPLELLQMLNTYDRLISLPKKATKKQILDILNNKS